MNAIVTKIIFIGLVGISFFTASCVKKVGERLEISIQNRTDSVIRVTLYPKVIYHTDSHPYYPTCEEGCGQLSPEFNLSHHEAIFSTGDLSIKPYALASKAFDSIYIRVESKDVTIKFTPESVAGYSENIFSDSSTWDFKTYVWELQNSLGRKETTMHAYTFSILEDKIIAK